MRNGRYGSTVYIQRGSAYDEALDVIKRLQAQLRAAREVVDAARSLDEATESVEGDAGMDAARVNLRLAVAAFHDASGTAPL